MKNKLILIAGGTASGKTSIANKVSTSLSNAGEKIQIITLDNYYKDIHSFEGKNNDEINWDSPDSIDWEALKKDINDLMQGKTIERKTFDYETSTYTKESSVQKPADYIVIEGLFSLYDEELVRIADIKIFVSADADIRIIRRILRDKKKRYIDFDEQKFMEKWNKWIKPMHDKYIEPSKLNAHFILQTSKLEWETEENIKKSIDLVVKLIK